MVKGGIEAKFRRAMKGLTTIVLLPAKGVHDMPDKWTVETSTGYGKYKPLKNVRVTVLRKPGRAARGKQKEIKPVFGPRNL